MRVKHKFLIGAVILLAFALGIFIGVGVGFSSAVHNGINLAQEYLNITVNEAGKELIAKCIYKGGGC